MKMAFGFSIIAMLLSLAALFAPLGREETQQRARNQKPVATAQQPSGDTEAHLTGEGHERCLASLDDERLAAMIDRRIQRYVEEHPEIFRAAKGNSGGLPAGLDWTPEKLEPVDVSGLTGTEEKLKKILERFEGAKSYSDDNALVDQMIGLGREAIEPLLTMLNSEGSAGFGDWAAKMAMEDALEGLLSVGDKEMILEQFERHGHFSELIDRYQFPESEDLVMAKFERGMGQADGHVVDAALMLNQDRAVRVLSEYVRRGENVSYAAEQLATIPGVQLDEVLREAAKSSRMVWDQATLARLLLERGMPEGLLLATVVLRSNGLGADRAKGRLAELISRLTPAQGTIGEMAVWLESNAENLRWNTAVGAFE